MKTNCRKLSCTTSKEVQRTNDQHLTEQRKFTHSTKQQSEL